MKKYVIGLLAVVLAIGSAFTTTQPKPVKPTVDYFYRYTGPSVDPAANLTPYQDASNWTNSSSSDANCAGGSYPCKVEVTQSTLSSYVSSIATASDVTNVTIASKN